MRSGLTLLLISVLLTGTGYSQDKGAAEFNTVRIESVNFTDTQLSEALDYLGSAVKLKRPVNFILLGEDTAEKTLSLNMKDVPLVTLLKYACGLTNNVALVVPDGILIGPKKDVLRAQSDWVEAKVVTGGGSAASQLASITIPALELEDTPISTVIQYLQNRTVHIKPGQKKTPPVNFLLINNPQAPVKDVTVSLKLKEAPLSSVIRFISAAAGHEVCYRIDRRAVVFGHPEDLKRAPRPLVAASPTFTWLKSKLIPDVNVSDASLEDALQLIRHHAGSRLNVVNYSKNSSGKVSLQLKNVSLATLLAYVCEQTNTNFKLDQRSIVFVDGEKRPDRNSPVSTKVTSEPDATGKPVFDK